MSTARDDDIDEVAVERAVHGPPVTLTRAERAEAVRRLAALAFNDSQIAERVGVVRKTVLRDRAQHGIPAGVESSSGFPRKRSA